MIKNTKKFIIVKSDDVAKKLIHNGLRQVASSGGVYTFINDTSNKLSFDSVDIKQLYFTDKLTF